MDRPAAPPSAASRLLALVALAASLAPARSLAQDLPAQVDDPGLSATTTADPDRATGWGCTRATLLSGEQCVFEGSAKAAPRKAQDQANAELATSMGQHLCDAAARPAPKEEPNKDLAALCRTDFKKALAASCDLGGRALADAQGRFTPAARDCYFALGEVLRNTARIAATGTACCACAVASGCTKTAHACLRFLAEDPPVLPACASAECYESCSHLLPHAPSTGKAVGGKGKGKDVGTGAPGQARPDDRPRPQGPSPYPYPSPYADPYQQPYPYANPYGAAPYDFAP